VPPKKKEKNVFKYCKNAKNAKNAELQNKDFLAGKIQTVKQAPILYTILE
jgi:hypothetical protein